MEPEKLRPPVHHSTQAGLPDSADISTLCIRGRDATVPVGAPALLRAGKRVPPGHRLRGGGWCQALLSLLKYAGLQGFIF